MKPEKCRLLTWTMIWCMLSVWKVSRSVNEAHVNSPSNLMHLLSEPRFFLPNCSVSKQCTHQLLWNLLHFLPHPIEVISRLLANFHVFRTSFTCFRIKKTISSMFLVDSWHKDVWSFFSFILYGIHKYNKYLKYYFSN